MGKGGIMLERKRVYAVGFVKGERAGCRNSESIKSDIVLCYYISVEGMMVFARVIGTLHFHAAVWFLINATYHQQRLTYSQTVG